MKALPSLSLLLLLSLTGVSSAFTVSGSLKLADGMPVSGTALLTIEQVGGETPPWSVTTGADGHWSLSDPLLFSSCAWGDVNADGDPDLFTMGFTGFPAQTITSILYLNQGGNVFTPVPTALPTLQFGDAAWGRWDHDSRLDLLLTGERPDGSPYIGVWLNPFTAENAAPSPPPAASLSVAGQVNGPTSSLVFHWGRGSDATNPATSLTYNIRIGTAPGLGDVFGGNATAQQQPLTSGHGLMHTQLMMPTGFLRPGITYYWSVQAVDAGFAVSPWVAGTPARFGLNGQTVAPLSLTTASVTATLPAGVQAGEYFVEFFPVGQPQNAIRTEPVAFSTATAPVTLAVTLAGLNSGRRYFYRFLLINGNNTLNLPFQELTMPVPPEIISLQRDAATGSVTLTFCASPVPEPVIELSSTLQEWAGSTGSTDLGGNLRQFVLPPRFNAVPRLFIRVRVGPEEVNEQ